MLRDVTFWIYEGFQGVDFNVSFNVWNHNEVKIENAVEGVITKFLNSTFVENENANQEIQNEHWNEDLGSLNVNYSYVLM